jgi:hypothetical protein
VIIMRVVPKKHGPKIAFYKHRITRWAAHAAQIGTTAADVAELAAVTEEAREALAAQQAAQRVAQSATLRLHLAVEKMGTRGSAIIQQVRVRAATSGDDGVYGLAWIPQPKKRSPIGAPGRPYQFSVTLQPIGWVELRWKCRNARGSVGTMYEVWRRIGGAGALERVGMSGTKRFVDKTVPAGSGVVMYQVRAVRTTAVGEWAQFNVYFGGVR